MPPCLNFKHIIDTADFTGYFFCTKSQRVCEEFISSLLRLSGYGGLVTVTKDLIIDLYHAASILVIFLVSNGSNECKIHC